MVYNTTAMLKPAGGWMHVYMYVCVHVYMYVRVHLYMYVRVHVYMYVYMYECIPWIRCIIYDNNAKLRPADTCVTFVCMYVCACIYLCLHIRMYSGI